MSTGSPGFPPSHSRTKACPASPSLILLLLVPSITAAIDFQDPEYSLKRVWSSGSLGIPGSLGGLLFSPDGDTLLVVGASESWSSALYAVPVIRDPASGEVADLGPIEQVRQVFAGSWSGLDAGFDYGPGGTLFYTYWSANYLGERPGGGTEAETTYEMGAVGIPSSIAGLTFSPFIRDAGTGHGLLQVSAWNYGGTKELFDVPLQPAGSGIFTPQMAEVFVSLPERGTGAIQYIPSGKYGGNLMFVNWDRGEVWILAIDPSTGHPIDAGTGLPALGTSNPRAWVFASGLGVGPWGLEFDPLSNDFFVSTYRGDPYNSIIQIGGFPPPPDLSSSLACTADPEGDQVVFTTTVSNLGPGAATGVRVVHSLPPGLQFQTAAPGQGSWTHDAEASTLDWEVGRLETGAEAVLRIEGLAPGGGSLCAEAIAMQAAVDPDPSNDTAACCALFPIGEVSCEAGPRGKGATVKWIVDPGYSVDRVAVIRDEVAIASVAPVPGEYIDPDDCPIGKPASVREYCIVGLDADGNEMTARACCRAECPELGRWLPCDSNGDGTPDVSDPVFTLAWLFQNGPEPGCRTACDCNGDEVIEISDAIHFLVFFYLGKTPPAPPFPDCGVFAGCPIQPGCP
jgi:uncharacterized repeat protein (TIGR01451 family)